MNVPAPEATAQVTTLSAGAVSVVESVTVPAYEGMRLPRASRASSVTVEKRPAVSAAGVVHAKSASAPAVNVTTAESFSATPSTDARTTRGPVTGLDSAPVTRPCASVTPPGCTSTSPVPDGVTVSATARPETGLPWASRAVTVIVLVVAPSATTGVVASTRLESALTAPATNVTSAVCTTATPPTVADTVTVSAFVSVSAPTACPDASVGANGSMATALPVAVSVTTSPDRTLAKRSRDVTVTELWLVPSAVTGLVALTWHRDALTAAGTTEAPVVPNSVGDWPSSVTIVRSWGVPDVASVSR